MEPLSHAHWSGDGRSVVLLLMVVVALPLLHGQNTPMLTVAQLEQTIAADHGEWDGRLAKKLADSKLTDV